MAATVHREGNLDLLSGKVAVLGYGSQGHAQRGPLLDLLSQASGQLLQRGRGFHSELPVENVLKALIGKKRALALSHTGE